LDFNPSYSFYTIDPRYLFTLQYSSLDYWKLIEKESQNNNSLSYDLQSIDNDLLLMVVVGGYDIVILHIDNSSTNVKIAFNAYLFTILVIEMVFHHSSLILLIMIYWQNILRLEKKINSSSTFQLVENIQINIY